MFTWGDPTQVGGVHIRGVPTQIGSVHIRRISTQVGAGGVFTLGGLAAQLAGSDQSSAKGQAHNCTCTYSKYGSA